MKIYNEDCHQTMAKMKQKVDLILTSPFYNTNRKSDGVRTLLNTKARAGEYDTVRYDMHTDAMDNEAYSAYMVDLCRTFDGILKENGVVLLNLSYGNENTEGMFLALAAILQNSPFTLADTLIWKKKCAFPNNCSKNRLTRIVEYVFVLCRRTERMTFHANKEISSYRKNGQPMYKTVLNFIEAKNNDGPCPYNKAAFSSEFAEKLLAIYARPGMLVYDPFMGTGTTAVACLHYGCDCIGSEISPRQCAFAVARLQKEQENIAREVV